MATTHFKNQPNPESARRPPAATRRPPVFSARDGDLDLEVVYRTELLGPSGESDLAHYVTRLAEGLDNESYTIAMEILAEAAVQDVFTAGARRCLEGLYSKVLPDIPDRIKDALEVLVHDGYVEVCGGGHRFASRLLKDWWAARFRDHHAPLESRFSDRGRGGVQ